MDLVSEKEVEVALDSDGLSAGVAQEFLGKLKPVVEISTDPPMQGTHCRSPMRRSATKIPGLLLEWFIPSDRGCWSSAEGSRCELCSSYSGAFGESRGGEG